MTQFKTRKRDKQVFPTSDGKEYRKEDNYHVETQKVDITDTVANIKWRDYTEDNWDDVSSSERNKYIKEEIIAKQKYKGTEAEAIQTIDSDDLHTWSAGRDSVPEIMEDTEHVTIAEQMWQDYLKVEKIEKHLVLSDYNVNDDDIDEELEDEQEEIRAKGYDYCYETDDGGVIYSKVKLPKINEVKW